MKKLQVFVSSTYIDMISERQAAVEAILRAGHIPAGMELFAAGDQSQWDTIRRWIDDSDVFMLIMGGRYGTVESQSNKSYTQLEYEYAIQTRKPYFAAVISDQLLVQKVKASGPDAMEKLRGDRLQAFREIVTSKTCRFFEDLNGLKLIIFESLSMLVNNEDLVGWVRGSDAVDAKMVLEQVSRLEAQNLALREELSSIKSRAALLSTSSTEASTISRLKDDAKNLLTAAASGDGYILYLRHVGGAVMQVANKNFIDPQNDLRQEARWKAALDELVAHRLVETRGTHGETFRLTHRGYEVADQLERKKS